MTILIKRADAALANTVEDRDFSFVVEAFHEPTFGQPVAQWPSTVVPAYRKDYRATNPESENESEALFLALDDQVPIGRAMISRNWNNYGLIDDIAVDAAYRGAGVGRLLMDACVKWSRTEGLTGITLETQNNNIAACRFYERYGFELGGIDRLLYRGLDPRGQEIALFWYLRFQGRMPDTADERP
ncbi:MAG: GNAT family N-acetyltransferase [Mesorhizobium sp.]|uniref:GNAT family N-acetyltransferase n=1 Tax=Mesorhizobium sp. TaxID=1871066 RepID=UPI001AD4AA6B|nr:GNAT family N-acetyltransferase [Mesorhizobium sp.]MBN9222400.1 GNAT family N-acetyltransferase [Mesorhizobium sp.]